MTIQSVFPQRYHFNRQDLNLVRCMRFALSPEGRGATGEYNSGNHKEDCSGRDHTLQHRQGRQMDPMTMDELNLHHWRPPVSTRRYQGRVTLRRSAHLGTVLVFPSRAMVINRGDIPIKPAIPVQSEISIGTRTIEKQRTIQEMAYAHTYTGYIDVYQNANSFLMILRWLTQPRTHLPQILRSKARLKKQLSGHRRSVTSVKILHCQETYIRRRRSHKEARKRRYQVPS